MFEVCSTPVGEEKDLLKEGWEPFGVSAHNTSYIFTNTTNNKRETHYQTTDYIYLRKDKPNKEED